MTLQRVQVRRTEDADLPPVGLGPGELAVEMSHPLRLWVGVPTHLDPNGRKLLVGGVYIGDTPPPTTNHGQLWWSSATGVLWIQYHDVDDFQWVQAAGTVTTTTFAALEDQVHQLSQRVAQLEAMLALALKSSMSPEAKPGDKNGV